MCVARTRGAATPRPWSDGSRSGRITLTDANVKTGSVLRVCGVPPPKPNAPNEPLAVDRRFSRPLIINHVMKVGRFR